MESNQPADWLLVPPEITLQMPFTETTEVISCKPSYMAVLCIMHNITLAVEYESLTMCINMD